MVSAWWHGIHPGYYLSFLTIPPTVMAEDAMRDAFRSTTDTTKQKLYDWINWFFKMRSLDYMAMGFLLLRFDYTINYWSSIYFLVHIYTVIFLIVGYLYAPRGKKISWEGRASQSSEVDKKVNWHFQSFAILLTIETIGKTCHVNAKQFSSKASGQEFNTCFAGQDTNEENATRCCLFGMTRRKIIRQWNAFCQDWTSTVQ